MNVEYSKTSPYYNTELYGKFLDIATLPVMPKFADDKLVTINATYQYRPDLLAFDLYGDASLWWVFALRNPNVITDPIFSMEMGAEIYVPKQETVMGLVR